MPGTTNTPTGTYPQSASVHHLDLNAIADRLLAGLNGADRNSENIARESGVSLVLMALAKGDKLDEHSSPGVVTVQVLRGALRLEAAGETEVLQPGHLVMLQPSVPHRHTAEERSVVLLTVTGATT